MKPGEIILKTTSKTGRKLTVRYVKRGDDYALTRYINKLSKERSFIMLQGETMTLKEERKYLDGVLKDMKTKQQFMVVVLEGNKILAVGGSRAQTHVRRHVATLGMSVTLEARGEGIGKLLLAQLIEQTKKQMKNIKIITLEVFANNAAALALYKKFGFKIIGTIPKGLKRRGRYVDDIMMYKAIR